MRVTEAQRLHLFKSFEPLLPPEDLSTLMSMLPPDGWTDLATKQDLEATRLALRTDMADLRTELTADMADLRTELTADMAGLRTELTADMAGLRTELKTEMAGLRTELRTDIAELRTEMHQLINAQTNRYVRWMFVNNAMLAGIFGTVVALT